MKINMYQKPHEWGNAKGLCVVIDVILAFTTAAFAFGRGARSITFVGKIEEALALHQENPSLLLMGEKEGVTIDGFHYRNSPTQIQRVDLTGKDLVQRTSAGTQGVVSCQKSEHLLVASFVNMSATLARIRQLCPNEVSFMVTGQNNGDEDLALAECLAEQLLGKIPVVDSYLKRVKESPEGCIFQDPAYPQFDRADLELALQVNRFSFAIEVHRVKNRLIGMSVLQGEV